MTAFKLKPDILNASGVTELNYGAFFLGRRTYLEVKPLTWSGVIAGIAQLGAYGAALSFINDDPFIPEIEWDPNGGPNQGRPVFVGGARVYLKNVGGLVFYTTDGEEARELAKAESPQDVLRQVKAAAPNQSNFGDIPQIWRRAGTMPNYGLTIAALTATVATVVLLSGGLVQ